MAETAIRGGVAAAVPHDSAAQARHRRGALYRRSARAGGHAARRGRPQHACARRDRAHGSRSGARGAGRGRGGHRRRHPGRQRRRPGVPGRSAVRRRDRRVRRPGAVRRRRRHGRAGAPRRAPGPGRVPRARGDPHHRGRARQGSHGRALARDAPRRPRARRSRARRTASGPIRIGGQDHFYLEGQVALAVPGEDGDMLVWSSTQHPSEVQHLVAKVLARPHNAVTVEVRRMGGGFGGKETQAAPFACMAALLAHHTRRPVKLRLDRDDDMLLTGKRHDFLIDYDVGFDDDGRIQGIVFEQAARCGFSPDLSAAIADRAMFHADNAYYPAARAHRLAPLQDPHRLEHRVSRLRRAAGHDGHREGDRRDRPRARPGPARGAPAQSVRSGRARRHALPHAGRGQRPAGADRQSSRKAPSYAQAPRGDRRVQRAEPGPQARPRADAGQVRHLVHRRPTSTRPARWCTSTPTAACT